MEVQEFGKGNSRKIVLIPGNMMSWRQFEHVIPLLEKDFHVIAVSTDGYDGTEETTFTTSAASAEKLEAYIRNKLDGYVPQYMSLGVFNGFVTKVIPHNQYRLYSKIQGKKKLPWLLKLYTRSDDESLLAQFSATPENISLETLQNCAKEGLQLYRDIDAYAPDPKAKVAVWYGAKEPNMKKAVQKLRRAFPALELHPFKGFGHGEIIAHPELMAAEIREFIGGMDDGR